MQLLPGQRHLTAAYQAVVCRCACSIVYDAGTASESYEWLDVAACSRDELHVLDDTVNVLDLSLPPSAQVLP